ncbi:ROK family protein [Tessaracoccus caeni]|uniref:ROK family protein n=1 Tax=Tessaracoccus caeni TaxID=3031239 RepID=UPI0023DC41A9|nr:ROK family protein [Tessaracoccus caeni]MDF1489634.1 ROK family protein [Tessaracoccus caeni]
MSSIRRSQLPSARRDPGAATSPQSMRERNLHALLDVFWSNADSSLTAKELMDASGLTRASVLDICRALDNLGWITEGAGARADTPGRRARQFQFNPARSLVVGADVNYTSVSAVVADLAGRILGSAKREFAAGYPWESRSDHLGTTISAALSDAGVSTGRIETVCVGLGSPLDETGKAPRRNPLWDAVKVEASSFLPEQADWQILVENDANLAAWAERGSGRVDPESTFVTLLADELLGCGIVFEGRLQRGAHGVAGEMGFATNIRDVENVEGIGSVWGYYRDELQQSGKPAREGVTAVDILLAAQQGDPVASAAVRRTADRLAKAIAVIAFLIDPGVVVVAGRFAEHAGRLVEMINWRLTDLRAPSPPTVITSALGGDVVLRGAIEMAIDDIRAGVSFAANDDGPPEGTPRKARRG